MNIYNRPAHLHHRIGDLENHIFGRDLGRILHHRIGDLENQILKVKRIFRLHHRIGDLENY